MKKSYTAHEGIRDEQNELIYGLSVKNGLLQQAVTITNVATKIPSTPRTRRLFLLIINVGQQEVFLGDATVTSSDGFPLYPRAVLKLDVEDDVDIYGIVSTGSCNLRIIEGW